MGISIRSVILGGFLSMNFVISVAHADGMVPETTVVLLKEGDEKSMKIKNTDDRTALLYVKVEHISEDKETWFVVTPPVSRVEPGETQLVRFIATNKEPLTTERLARVIIDGVPERKDPKASIVAMRVRQNLPVVLHPKSLSENRQPWTLLKWEKRDGGLVAFNDSPYVVRFAAQATLLPTNKPAVLSKTYLLPGERLKVIMPKKDQAEFEAELKARGAKTLTEQEEKAELADAEKLDPAVTGIRIQPATNYGYMADKFEAPLVAATAIAPAAASGAAAAGLHADASGAAVATAPTGASDVAANAKPASVSVAVPSAASSSPAEGQ